MTDQDQKLCDNCHERPAFNHICYGGQAGENRSLCQICLVQDLEVGGLVQHYKEAIRVGHCKYCGAPAETGYGRFSSYTGGHLDLLCKACGEDLAEFSHRSENALPDFKVGDEVALKAAMTQFEDMQERQDQFIRQRILDRKSKE